MKSLTYLELQRLVSKAAAIIRRAMGPSASAKGVGLIFDPTVESVVGILGVLASGHFFCRSRRTILPQESKSTSRMPRSTSSLRPGRRFRIGFFFLQSEQVVFVDELAENDVETVAPATLNPHQLAAILYTSGSTGIPKGVTHTHKTLMHMVRIKGNALGISPSDRIAGLSTFTFGSYYLNVFGTVLSGATLHPYDFYRFPFENLESWLGIDRRITHFHCTPTTLRQFLAALDEPTVLCGSAARVARRGNRLSKRRLSVSKKTFASNGALHHGRDDRDLVFMHTRFFRHRSRTESSKSPWGLSIRNAVSRCAMTRAASFRPLERGKSPSVAKSFLRAIGSGQSSMPRSMSSVRARNVTSVRAIWERLPRMDCSIRKADPIFRSRFGECGSTWPILKQSYTITPESNKPWSSGEPGRTTTWNWSPILSQLAIAPLAEAKSTNSWRRSYRPTKFPRVSFFSSPFPSRTRTRWTERRFLIRTKSRQQKTRNGLAPRNDVEALLHGIWAEILGHENFGVTEPFLEIGGDSLAAMRLRNHIEAELGVSIPLRDLFTAATIESLAGLVQHLGTEQVTTRRSDHLKQSTRP